MKRIVSKDARPHGLAIERRLWLKDSLHALGAFVALRGLAGCAAKPSSDQAGSGSGGASAPAPAASGSGGAASGAAASGGVQNTGTPAAGASGQAAPSTAAAAGKGGTGGSKMSAGASAGNAPPRIACEVIVPTFPSLADGGPGTTFTRMDQSSTSDWIVIAGATAQIAAKVPDGILNLLRALDTLYVGYPLSVLQHSLQAATRAMKANASDDLVLCALCHDIGMALSVEGHAEISAAILRGYVAENAYRVVRHHTEYEWQHGGAPAGQPKDQRARYSSQPWFADAARFVDEWEQVSYDPEFSASALTDFQDLVTSKFGGAGSVNQTTASDCIAKNGGSMP